MLLVSVGFLLINGCLVVRERPREVVVTGNQPIEHRFAYDIAGNTVYATDMKVATASAFDDLSAPAERVRRLHGVSDARVQRRLPGALRVVVREVEPAAFVPGPRGMIVVDAAGRPLPFDPARAGLDLPIAATADSGVEGVLALMQAVEPPLYEEVTAARSYGRGSPPAPG